MKKAILLWLLVCSSMVMASQNPFRSVIKKLEEKYYVLKDNKGNSLELEDISISEIKNKIIVKLEIEDTFGDNKWNKFDKSYYKKITKQIAEEVRSEVKKTNKIEVILEKENILTEEKSLLSKEVF